MSQTSSDARALDLSRYPTTERSELPSLSVQASNQDWQNHFGGDRARSYRDNAAYVQAGYLPDTQVPPESVLSDANATAQQKLQSVEQLVASGKNEVTITDQDGTQRQVRLEVEHEGNANLVHMYTDEGGKERVLLRGISNGDGTFSHETDANGNQVSFNGTWWSQHMAGQSSLAGGGQDDGQAGAGQGTYGDAGGYQSGSNDDSNSYGYRPPYQSDRYNPQYQSDSYNPAYQSDQYNPQYQSDLSNPDYQPDQYGDRNPMSGDQAAWNAYFDKVGTGQAADGSVYFRAGMAIDADGAPDARRIDPSGSSQTSLRYANGASVDARQVPYIVLPGGQYQRYGIHPGDMAAVRYNGRVVFAQFADVGPSNRIGEGSMNLAQALGINPNPRNGGVQSGVEYIVFPGSGNRGAASPEEIAATGSQMLNGDAVV